MARGTAPRRTAARDNAQRGSEARGPVATRRRDKGRAKRKGRARGRALGRSSGGRRAREITPTVPPYGFSEMRAG